MREFTGGLPAQTLDEIIDEQKAAKEKALAPHRGQSFYRYQSGQYNEAQLKNLVGLRLEELAGVATSERVSLSDINEVKKRTLIYLRACQETGSFPSTMGLARSMGYSRRGLHYWRERNPQSETARWLEMVADTFADILSQSALKNNANPIITIFLSKSLYDMRETSEIIVKPGADENPVNDFNEEDIRKRYMIEEVEADEGKFDQ